MVDRHMMAVIVGVYPMPGWPEGTYRMGRPQKPAARPRLLTMMKLIGSTASPYVRKVRVVLAEKKLDYRFEEDNVWSADTAIGSFNPLGKVPCLMMEGGEAVFD